MIKGSMEDRILVGDSSEVICGKESGLGHSCRGYVTRKNLRLFFPINPP